MLGAGQGGAQKKPAPDSTPSRDWQGSGTSPSQWARSGAGLEKRLFRGFKSRPRGCRKAEWSQDLSGGADAQANVDRSAPAPLLVPHLTACLQIDRNRSPTRLQDPLATAASTAPMGTWRL